MYKTEAMNQTGVYNSMLYGGTRGHELGGKQCPVGS
jgi:hypothetical protein